VSTLGQEIIAYALENERNLRSAFAVGEVLTSLKSRVIAGILDEMSMVLGASLGQDWQLDVGGRSSEFRRLRDDVTATFGGYWLTRPTWNGAWAVGMECQRNGLKDFLYGIKRRDRGMARVSPADWEPLLGKGQSSASWEWYRYCEEHRDWNEDSFVLFAFRRKEIATEFAARLAGVARAADSVLSGARA
jgi:hypothetical protein